MGLWPRKGSWGGSTWLWLRSESLDLFLKSPPPPIQASSPLEGDYSNMHNHISYNNGTHYLSSAPRFGGRFGDYQAFRGQHLTTCLTCGLHPWTWEPSETCCLPRSPWARACWGLPPPPRPKPALQARSLAPGELWSSRGRRGLSSGWKHLRWLGHKAWGSCPHCSGRGQSSSVSMGTALGPSPFLQPRRQRHSLSPSTSEGPGAGPSLAGDSPFGAGFLLQGPDAGVWRGWGGGGGKEEPRGRHMGPPGRGQLPAAGSCPAASSPCFSLTPELPKPVFRALSPRRWGPVGTGVHGQALQGSWVLGTLSSPGSSLRPEPRPLPCWALKSSSAVSLRRGLEGLRDEGRRGASGRRRARG